MQEDTNRKETSGSSSREGPSSQIWNNGAKVDCNTYQETALDDTKILLAKRRQSDGSIKAASVGAGGRNSKFSLYQTITLISVSLAILTNWLTYSVVIVFYPTEAKGRGMTHTAIGLVFGTFSFVSMIASPVWGKILPVVRSRFLFLMGSFVAGFCNILFGFLIDMPSGITFTLFSFILRFFEGLGSSACITAATAIIAFAFPENIGTAVSVVEMVAGASYGIGPALGGLLFDIGGFKLPFFVLGGSVLATMGVNFFLMPQQGCTHDKTGSVFRIARIPAVWFAIFAGFGSTIGVSTLYPTLSPYLEKNLNFTVIEASVAFGSFGLIYAVTAMLWGRIADKTKKTRLMLVLGAFFSAVSFLLLGPSPVLPISPNKPLVIFSLPFSATATALLLMASLADMFITVKWYGMEYDLETTAIVSGLYNFSVNMGVTVGPSIGGALTDHFGFANMTFFVACGYVVMMIVIAVFWAWEYRSGKGRRLPRTWVGVKTSSTEVDEKKLLLSKRLPNDV